MKKTFTNRTGMECTFTDEGITFLDKNREIYYPYGGLDSIAMSLLGILQAVCQGQVCTFAVNHQDRKEVKELIKTAKAAKETAPYGDPVVVNFTQRDDIPADLPAEEQLKRYKALFVQGAISKEEYDARKRILSGK